MQLQVRTVQFATHPLFNAADTAGILGKARFLYMVTVRVRPGRALEYEDQIKMVRDARAKGGQRQTWFVRSHSPRFGPCFYLLKESLIWASLPAAF